MPKSNSKELLTIAECARRLNVHPNTVRNLILRGELKAVRIGERIVRIAEDEFERATSPYQGGGYGIWNR